MAWPYLWLREEFGPAVKGAWGANVSWPRSLMVYQEFAYGWAGHPPYWQGFRVRTEQGMGCV